MTPAEMVILVRFVKAVCPAQILDEHTPRAWHRIIGDLRFTDCEEAITALKRGNNPPQFIDVSDIRKAVRSARNDRIDKAPWYEPDSGLSLAEWRRRAADGEPLPLAQALKARDMRIIEGTFQEVGK